MLSIFLKEINAIFSSLIGYIVIGVFLIMMGLIMWVFPDFSILNYSYATLDQLFSIAPFIFLFLIPAITMRSFAEEQQSGTIELLATRPLSDWAIILGKYLACVVLVLFSLLPTILYYYSVYQLGSPPGNLDSGAILGSYLGLALLAAAYVAIGIFASSLTNNQIVSFVLAVFLCFFVHLGFYFLSSLPIFVGKVDDVIQMLGIDYHYNSISRGLLDSRDLVYFLSIIAIFLVFTKTSLERRKWQGNFSWQSLTQAFLVLGILIFLNILAQPFYFISDLTEEKRYTLTEPTKKMLRDLDEVLYGNVLLDGDFPAGVKRLQNAVRQLLLDFQSESGLVEFSFEDPNEGTVEERNERRLALLELGIEPTNLRVKSADGNKEIVIYPYAQVFYRGRERSVNLLESEMLGVPSQVVLNNSIGLLEYKLTNIISKILSFSKPTVLFTEGHGELAPPQVQAFREELFGFYNTDFIDLDSVVQISQDCAVLVVARPRGAFSEQDKFKIDQYVMNGGKVLWLIDRLAVNLDSLRVRNEYVPVEYPLNLEDQLFKYGARIQPNLVLDLECTRIPLVSGQLGSGKQYDLFPWYYHPLVAPTSNHPIVKRLDRINLYFPSSVDTIRTSTPVKKTVLLQSSNLSRLQLPPVRLNFEILRYDPDPSKFNKGRQNLAVLLEGEFPSLYKGRVSESFSEGLTQLGLEYRERSVPTKMIVVADGDVAKNFLNPSGDGYQPVGFNPFERRVFTANNNFLINAVEYLIDEKGVIEARGKDVKLRLLDTVKAKAEETKWQMINIVLPILFLLLFGLLYNWMRRRRYAR